MSDTQEQERDSGHVDQAGEIGSEASSEVLQAWSPAVGTRTSAPCLLDVVWLWSLHTGSPPQGGCILWLFQVPGDHIWVGATCIVRLNTHDSGDLGLGSERRQGFQYWTIHDLLPPGLQCSGPVPSLSHEI